jgi:hypothetical protein
VYPAPYSVNPRAGNLMTSLTINFLSNAVVGGCKSVDKVC